MSLLFMHMKHSFNNSFSVLVYECWDTLQFWVSFDWLIFLHLRALFLSFWHMPDILNFSLYVLSIIELWLWIKWDGNSLNFSGPRQHRSSAQSRVIYSPLLKQGPFGCFTPSPVPQVFQSVRKEQAIYVLGTALSPIFLSSFLPGLW